jgi:hypothetical protein
VFGKTVESKRAACEIVIKVALVVERRHEVERIIPLLVQQVTKVTIVEKETFAVPREIDDGIDVDGFAVDQRVAALAIAKGKAKVPRPIVVLRRGSVASEC